MALTEGFEFNPSSERHWGVVRWQHRPVSRTMKVNAPFAVLYAQRKRIQDADLAVLGTCGLPNIHPDGRDLPQHLQEV